ncbi:MULTISPECIES: hypothetical protein [Priestia]|uniref:hypothetical protein n=1 Tax=Priestia TaxID=2800373 RepID=UPI0013F3C5D0|nr:hypothetical protein [Priestia megaterium]MCF8886913.1 hypothetical protein [Priestia megaterium]NGY81191.1 hypothetical protein [Priestia megaterium]
MNKVSAKLVEIWLKIPRWFRLFTLKAITIYVICIGFFKGIEVLFHLESLDLEEWLICLTSSLLILIIFNKFSKRK